MSEAALKRAVVAVFTLVVRARLREILAERARSEGLVL